eukprot:3116987-Rhodomonas_salina.1
MHAGIKTLRQCKRDDRQAGWPGGCQGEPHGGVAMGRRGAWRGAKQGLVTGSRRWVAWREERASAQEEVDQSSSGAEHTRCEEAWLVYEVAWMRARRRGWEPHCGVACNDGGGENGGEGGSCSACRLPLASCVAHLSARCSEG